MLLGGRTNMLAANTFLNRLADNDLRPSKRNSGTDFQVTSSLIWFCPLRFMAKPIY